MRGKGGRGIELRDEEKQGAHIEVGMRACANWNWEKHVIFIWAQHLEMLVLLFADTYCLTPRSRCDKTVVRLSFFWQSMERGSLVCIYLSYAHAARESYLFFNWIFWVPWICYSVNGTQSTQAAKVSRTFCMSNELNVCNENTVRSSEPIL